MATLVGAITTSHSSYMISSADPSPDGAAARVYSALAAAREWLVDLRPDALVIVGTDHFNTFFVDDLPPLCVGVADRYRGWGDNMPMYSAPGSAAASRALVNSLHQCGIDEVRSMDDMQLDHAFFGPLHFLTPDMDLPVIPIFQNCIAEPLQAPQRAHEFGEALRSAIESLTEWERVVVVGSGGLSHWIGGPEHSLIAPEFDRRFLDAFVAGDTSEFRGMSSDKLEEAAGNGGHEIRNWLSARGCAPEFEATVRCYEVMTQWFVGFGVVTLLPPTGALS